MTRIICNVVSRVRNLPSAGKNKKAWGVFRCESGSEERGSGGKEARGEGGLREFESVMARRYVESLCLNSVLHKLLPCGCISAKEEEGVNILVYQPRIKYEAALCSAGARRVFSRTPHGYEPG